MRATRTLLATAMMAALMHVPSTVLAQTAQPAVASATAKSLAPRQPTDWVEYDTTTVTPVLDAVTGHLLAARKAIASNDNAAGAEALHAAALELNAQADRASKVEGSAAQVKAAKETKQKLAALSRRLEKTAAQVKAGKVPTLAALDTQIGQAARADLDRRWLVSDVTTWYPVVEEPHRHLVAAMEAYGKKDYKAAAAEVHKAAAYVRLEAARAAGDTRVALLSLSADLDKVGRDIGKGTVKDAKWLENKFSRVEHALALSHRAKAAEAWGRKAYDEAGYELKAAAHGLENAARWSGNEAKDVAADAVSGTRALGDKLIAGGTWAKDEVAKAFETLGTAIDRLGQKIGSKVRTATVKLG